MPRILARASLLRSVFPGPILPLTARRGAIPLPSLNQAARPRLFSRFPPQLTSNAIPPPKLEDGEPPKTLSARLKHLIKSYGWYALGVYAVLSVVDFSVAFGLVNLVGAPYATKLALEVKTYLTSWVSRPTEPGLEEKDPATTPESGNEGLYAMLVVAYTIHKTLFLPVRVGLTAALTPRIVGWLRTRGWTGVAGAKRAVGETRERIRTRNLPRD